MSLSDIFIESVLFSVKFMKLIFSMAFSFFKCICLLLAVLSLCCCTQAFSSCSE